jgi:hypothetical protein
MENGAAAGRSINRDKSQSAAVKVVGAVLPLEIFAAAGMNRELLLRLNGMEWNGKRRRRPKS